jgi:hypothetical protein
MNKLIRSTTIVICLIAGQAFCPSVIRATEANTSSVMSDVVSDVMVKTEMTKSFDSESLGNKQNFPQCKKNCNNSGSEGGGGQ